MNLPNKLTVLRMILVPFFVFFMLSETAGYMGGHVWAKWLSFVIFIVASVTDTLDGQIARKYNLVTNFGKFMDPLADKILVCSAMICLIPLGRIPAWAVIIMMGREFVISGFRLVASDAGIVIAAGVWGKIKTVVQMIMIIVLLAGLGQWMYPVETALIWASVVLSVISLCDYVWKNRQVLTKGGM